VLLKLGIARERVIEAGSARALTLALAFHVGDTGRVYTFERRPEFFDLAGKNLEPPVSPAGSPASTTT
jgi:tRNA (adenine57-N1/adenine58-N1)-methyltransferase